MANSPDGDGVKLDGEGRIGDGGDSGHDGLCYIFALKGGREVAAPGNFWNKKNEFLDILQQNSVITNNIFSPKSSFTR